MNPASIEKAIQDAGLSRITPEALDQFGVYLELLLRWNSKLNLTAIREPEEIVRRHFVECIQCAQAIPVLTQGATLLDFGSGAGFPGIPIAICRLEIRVTLAESQGKKASFLRETVRTFKLDAEVVSQRVEDLPPGRCFSVVTMRGVDKMERALPRAVERLDFGGWLVLFATAGTEARLKTAVPDVAWQEAIPVLGLNEGKLLVGRLSR